MDYRQLSFIDTDEIPNPLKGKRICLTGEFRMPQKELSAKLKAAGVETIDRVSDTRVYKEGDAIPPVKESTTFFVVGANPNEDSMKRYALNEHDGYHAKMISEDKLYDYLAGHYADEDMVPDVVEKRLYIDMSYYNWTAPVINGKTFVSRVSSPLNSDKDGLHNPLSQLEIYVPTLPDADMDVFRQIIGNFGGYANAEYFDETNIVMLGDSTLAKLQQGIEDEIILGIEQKYNSSGSKIFNVQFTCESDFIRWVQARLEHFPDESTKVLLEKYLTNKSHLTLQSRDNYGRDH